MEQNLRYIHVCIPVGLCCTMYWGLLTSKDRCQQSAFDPRAVEEASEQIDWGELEPSQAMDVVLGQESNPFTSGDIDWDVVGTLDVCEIEVVEESALGEEKSALGEEESAPGEEEGMLVRTSRCVSCYIALICRVGDTPVEHKYTQPLCR